MNLKALHKLSYGLYVVTSRKGDRLNGQIANTVFQITSEPPTVAVSINKYNLTHELIRRARSSPLLSSARIRLSPSSVISASSQAGISINLRASAIR